MSTQPKPRTRSNKNKKAETEVVSEVVVAPEPTPTPVVAEAPTAPVEAPPVATHEPVSSETEAEVEAVEEVEAVKAEENLDPVEKLQSQFDSLRNQLSAELSLLGESDKAFKKARVLTFLRKVNRQVNMIEKQTFRLVKNKKSVRKNKVVSGFQKPTRISKDLAKFTGWNENDLHSRVEVTKFICDYIKTNNLQNPQDRRQIVPDAKLQKLLGYNPKKETEPLRYYSIQFHLNKMKHFPKEPVVVV